MKPSSAGCFLVVDTNILVDIQDIENVDWGVTSSKIYVIESVLNEIQVLSGQVEAPDLARKADRAYTYAAGLMQRAQNGGYQLAHGNRLFFVQAPLNYLSSLDPTDVDHQQIALAVKLLRENPDRFVAIVTQDRKMSDIAHAAHPDLEVINPGNGDPLRQIAEQTVHLSGWKDKLKEDRTASTADRSLKQPSKKPRHKPDPQQVKESIARNLYNRIRSANHRAILAVSPLELRLTLSAHIIPMLTRNKRRVVLIFVQDEQEAGWWAGQLRKRCALPSGSIVSFGSERVTSWGPVRVVIYRYDQIERRVQHHIARFQRAEKKITALVDGCDLLDPVAIAMLLFECDQFIGFNRLPGGHAQAVGSRMLNAFFQQQTVASYTFADAEQDGWLHAFDVIRQPVELFPDEREHYQEVNQKFVTLHSKVTRKYPELQNASDFWHALPVTLARHVDHQAADLFSLREETEEIAQMAREKIDIVTRLVQETGKPARCIIFDYEQLWTPILQKQLSQQDWRTDVVTKGATPATWNEAWRKFEATKLDCLIVQDVPPLGLIPAVVNRLILLSTLTSLTKLAAMTDWALTLANSGPSVCVDLLYTINTPEQEAMIAFADTCCGLRFN